MKYILALILMSFLLQGCGIQAIPKAKNDVDAKFAEVTNQYKRRSDLIPNLVATVKGYAAQEKDTLTAVVEARAKATQTKIDVGSATPDQVANFQKNQGALSSALSRLMVVVEKYPNLKSDQNFRDLQAQLEGTENRITVARNRYIESIKIFNDYVTVPPYSFVNSIFYHHSKMPQWDVDEAEKEQVKQTPKVEF